MIKQLFNVNIVTDGPLQYTETTALLASKSLIMQSKWPIID